MEKVDGYFLCGLMEDFLYSMIENAPRRVSIEIWWVFQVAFIGNSTVNCPFNYYETSLDTTLSLDLILFLSNALLDSIASLDASPQIPSTRTTFLLPIQTTISRKNSISIFVKLQQINNKQKSTKRNIPFASFTLHILLASFVYSHWHLLNWLQGFQHKSKANPKVIHSKTRSSIFLLQI